MAAVYQTLDCHSDRRRVAPAVSFDVDFGPVLPAAPVAPEADAPRLSVVIPMYNEEDNVAHMHRRLDAALARIGCDYEIILVDDGSKDGTFDRMRELVADDPHLRVLKLARNYGQTPAMVAGIDHARGAVIVTMDGDLQNDPEDIPEFLSKIEDGYDIVVGWRFNRQDAALKRKLPSRIANWLIMKVSGVRVKDNGCSLKAFRGTLIKNIPLYSDMHRFMPAMASLAGARLCEIKVRHHARQFGKSKYGLSRTFKVLIDLIAIKAILKLTEKPAFWFFKLAALITVVIGGLVALQLVEGFADGYALFELALLFAGLNAYLLSMGALIHMILRLAGSDAVALSRLTARGTIHPAMPAEKEAS